LFIVSNAPLAHLSRTGPVWSSTEDMAQQMLLSDGALLAFEGRLYPDSGTTVEALADHWRRRRPIDRLAEFRGQYAGAFADTTGRVYAFADHLGLHDVYMWRQDGHFAVSNDLAALLRSIPADSRRLDEEALTDWYLLGFVVGDRTFVRAVSRLGPGAVAALTNGHVEVRSFWRYEMRPSDQSRDELAAELHASLETATRRMLTMAPGRRWLTGVSGGLDSRLTAAYACRAGAEVMAYFFGERQSDAGALARLVADRLRVPLQFPGGNREFHRFFEHSLEFRPMANLEWCKYVTGRQLLPSHDALVSGRLGDHLLSDSATLLMGPEQDRELAEALFRRSANEPCDPRTRDAVVSRIETVLARIGGSVAQRRQSFAYLASERSVQHCGLFHDFGSHPHFSPFEDLSVFELCLRIPVSWRIRNRFYHLFFQRYLGDVSEAQVRLDDGRNGHKPLERWLRGNHGFRWAALRLISDPEEDMRVHGRTIRYSQALEAIVAGHASRRDIHQFFRRLTVLAFRQTHLA
jgi:hypothetical protein